MGNEPTVASRFLSNKNFNVSQKYYFVKNAFRRESR